MRSAVATSAGNGAGGAAGVGLRLPHLADVAAGVPGPGWLEIHPENFLANPHAHELLLQVAERQRISVHTVGLSIGSVDGVDRAHLARMRRLVDELDPLFVSGHLAWSTHGGRYLNDLLPLPYDEASLGVVAANLDEVQQRLGRPYLVENPASYLTFPETTLAETQFLAELCRRTGCQLLCDVSNVVVSAANLGYDPYAYIDALPAHAVRQLHLGGFTAETDDALPGTTVLIDTHASRIAPAAWELYAHAVRRFGRLPTLIEWDNDLPAFAELLLEAEWAAAVAASALNDHRHANAG